MEPLSPPTELGEITVEELKAYDGSNPKKPLLIAIKGQIYDVSQSRKFYGPSGPYALFGGKDASRALATLSFEEKNFTGDISGLSSLELENLQDWENKFMNKYAMVGTIKKTEVVADHGSVARPVKVVSSMVQQEEEEHQIKGCFCCWRC
ncbi:membrane steroid-binding protein 2-like [Macadamia integrifolia]|uniref:membrane steroid-binding protein 2-like n=1 Tax=Macadamia integrifolia TaxID=60698 RepID=UPI001C4ED7C9|nr:membrane steroid-binding protein 2-like [Macadamia integrifolia]